MIAHPGLTARTGPKKLKLKKLSKTNKKKHYEKINDSRCCCSTRSLRLRKG